MGIRLLERVTTSSDLLPHAPSHGRKLCMWAEFKDTSSNTLQRLWLNVCDAELYEEHEVANHLKCDCSCNLNGWTCTSQEQLMLSHPFSVDSFQKIKVILI